MIYAASLLCGYLIGSIPFGLVLTKIFGYGDIRKIGSGNIGATNVLRTGNKGLALLTLLLDGGKGAAAVGLALFMLTFDAALLAGFGAFLGHLFPVWLRFKGGKGVATTIGIMLALYFPLGVTAILLWLATAAIFRMSSLAALVAIGLSPLAAFAFTHDFSDTITAEDGSMTILVNHHLDYLPYLCAVFAVLVFYKHKDNIKRLMNGTEPKIGGKNDSASTQK